MALRDDRFKVAKSDSWWYRLPGLRWLEAAPAPVPVHVRGVIAPGVGMVNQFKFRVKTVTDQSLNRAELRFSRLTHLRIQFF